MKNIIFYLLLILLLFVITKKKKENEHFSNQENFYSEELTVENIRNLKKGQSIMSEILKLFDQICIQNNINYWCLGGTLIGALRHKGWVPWDADIDVGMLEKDYQKFKSFIHLFPENIEFSEPTNKPCSKLRSKDAIYTYAKWAQKDDLNKGLQLDIFLFKLKNEFIIPNKNNFLGNICGIPDKKKRAMSDIFPTKRVKFEYFEVNIPNEYKKISKEIWGNFPPEMIPINKRKPHEGNIEIIENFSSQYKNEYNKYFIDILNNKERNILDLILKSCIEHLEKKNIQYFFSFGSLIGAARHGNRIPWDDDIDISIEKNKLNHLLSGLKPIKINKGKSGDYQLNENIIIKYKKWGVPIKFYYKNTKYPFIDIYLYDKKNDYIHIDKKQMIYGHIQKFDELEKDIFPLKNAKFGNFRVKIPNNYKKILKNQFGKDVFTKFVVSWNHANKKKVKDVIFNISEVNPNFLQPLIYEEKYFKDILNIKEKEIINSLLNICLEHTETRNIDYFFAFGSLIGACRHGYRMPWDDDIDIIINITDLHKFLDELELIDNTINGTRWEKKFYLKDDIIIIHKNWGIPLKIKHIDNHYPFIDINLYKKNNNYLVVDRKQLKYGHIKYFKELKTDIFPLKKAKFNNYVVKIPNNYEKILKNQYGDDILDVCKITYNHKKFCKNKYCENENASNKIHTEIKVKDLDSNYFKPEIFD